ncbi:MAG TPA: hypothetical protein VLV88_09630 [Terriglobales bacterium]|nr:hypothetical protein [Terriglobales bacterium]
MERIQWQPQEPPQQPPPPPPENELDGPDEPPLLDPFAALNTDSWIVALLLAHFGQEISCCLLITIFSNSALQSSQMYS